MARYLKQYVMELVGKQVEVVLIDGGPTLYGKLEYIPEFSARYGYRKPDWFALCNYQFKVSHIAKITKQD